MDDKEAFDLLRQCVAFGSAKSPYVLTDSQEFDLFEFLSKLEEEHGRG